MMHGHKNIKLFLDVLYSQQLKSCKWNQLGARCILSIFRQFYL